MDQDPICRSSSGRPRHVLGRERRSCKQDISLAIGRIDKPDLQGPRMPQPCAPEATSMTSHANVSLQRKSPASPWRESHHKSVHLKHVRTSSPLWLQPRPNALRESLEPADTRYSDASLPRRGRSKQWCGRHRAQCLSALRGVPHPSLAMTERASRRVSIWSTAW